MIRPAVTAADEPSITPPPPRARVDRLLDAMLLYAVAVAPLLLGGRPWSLRLPLSGVLLVIAIAVLIRRRAAVLRFRRVGWTLLMAASLVAWGLLGIANTAGDFVPPTLTPLAHVSWLPASVSRPQSVLHLASLVGPLLLVPAAGVRSFHPAFRRRLVAAIGFSGLALAGVGLLQATPVLAWSRELIEASPWAHGRPFATLDYHGTAGSILLLAFPAAFATALLRAGRAAVPLAASVLLVFVLAAFVNIARSALVLTLGMAAVLALPLAWLAMKRLRPATLVALIIITVLVTAGGVEWIRRDPPPVIQRMLKLRDEVEPPWYPRRMEMRAAMTLVRDRPTLGYGVGGYPLVAHHTAEAGGHFFTPPVTPGEPYTVVAHLHNDHVETLAEWGGIGSAFWVLLILPGGVAAAAGVLRRGTSAGDRLIAAASLLALGGVATHALVDCPLQVPAVQVWAAAWLGVALATTRREPIMSPCASC
jgi:O-antigen ligase